MLSIAFLIFLTSLNEFNVYGAFTVSRDDEVTGDKAEIILLTQKYKSDRFSDEIIGQVKNVGNGTADFVKISFTLFNKKGELIGTDYTYADQKILKPGQKSAFNEFVDEETGDKVKAFEVSLSWDNPDGTEEYIENVDIKDENNYLNFQDGKSKKLTEEDIERLGLFGK
jgi:hypothetical protein